MNIIRKAIVDQTEARLRLQPGLNIPYLVVQLGDPFCSFEPFRYSIPNPAQDIGHKDKIEFLRNLVEPIQRDAAAHIDVDSRPRSLSCPTQLLQFFHHNVF